MSTPLTRRESESGGDGEADWLKSLDGAPKKYEVATYDIETTTDLSRVYLVGFFDGARYFYFESEPSFPETPGGAIDQFMRWLLPNIGYTRFRIYAHNGGNFDHLFITQWALAHPELVELEIIPIQSSILSLSIKPEGRDKKFQFIDSIKLMPGSLESIAQAFGFEGGKVKGINYDTLHLDPRRYEYLQTDCELLWKCIDKFTRLLLDGGGEVGITTPATAMKVFRRRFQDAPIETNRHFPGCPDSDCRGCLHDFVRLGYSGGRTELYEELFNGHDSTCCPIGKLGNGLQWNDQWKCTCNPSFLNVGDFNSMYPAVMRERMPCFLVGVEDGKCDWRKYTKAFRVGFVDCDVYVPTDCYLPPLAHRYDGKLIFPVGRFRGVWTTEELKRLFEVGGRIEKEHKSVWFGTKYLFDSYVATWYAFRDKARPDYSPAMDTIAKLMLNSLYGKFGQGEEREKIWIYPRDEELARGTLVQLPRHLDGVMKEDVFTKTNYVIPHIAAWITALGRCKLWDASTNILKSGHRLFYCDTDSIFTTAPVQASKTLGELKLEYRWSYGRFIAPKLYAGLKEDGTQVIKAKGFSGGFGADKLTLSKFFGLVSGREQQTVKRITKLREGLSKGEERFPRMKEITKSAKGTDTKRTHFPNGSTMPLVLGME